MWQAKDALLPYLAGFALFPSRLLIKSRLTVDIVAFFETLQANPSSDS